GYVILKKDTQDARSKTVFFTEAGWKLMMDSFIVIEEIEQRCSHVLGAQTMEALRKGLAAFINAYESDSNEKSGVSDEASTSSPFE
ncbi:MAG: hypothetical protein ABR508_11085, partial [Candidatus Baltobacteraceae bacterium]